MKPKLFSIAVALTLVALAHPSVGLAQSASSPSFRLEAPTFALGGAAVSTPQSLLVVSAGGELAGVGVGEQTGITLVGTNSLLLALSGAGGPVNPAVPIHPLVGAVVVFAFALAAWARTRRSTRHC